MNLWHLQGYCKFPTLTGLMHAKLQIRKFSICCFLIGYYTFSTISPIRSRNFNLFKYILLKVLLRDAFTEIFNFYVTLPWKCEFAFIWEIIRERAKPELIFGHCTVTACRITYFEFFDFKVTWTSRSHDLENVNMPLSQKP